PVKLIQKDWKEKGIRNKKETLDFLRGYEHSSYLDYFGIYRTEGKIISKESFPNYFPNTKDFNNEIFSWLDYKQL
ncbi:MAG: hypothetical protein NT068_04260, partial [Candidatus Nomurabacteria bacterium]|nr:hypothetical protein [Candidatus Nomurabacteria bacterium]